MSDVQFSAITMLLTTVVEQLGDIKTALAVSNGFAEEQNRMFKDALDKEKA